jgi:hypothetical protein
VYINFWKVKYQKTLKFNSAQVELKKIRVHFRNN